jgi:hypothetical protein
MQAVAKKAKSQQVGAQSSKWKSQLEMVMTHSAVTMKHTCSLLNRPARFCKRQRWQLQEIAKTTRT